MGRVKFYRTMNFYRAMHVSAKRIFATVSCRPSICLSVRPSVTFMYRGHASLITWNWKVNAYTRK